MENWQMYSKAIAGFVVSLLVGLATQYGLDLSSEVQQSLGVLVTAVITGVSVWYVRNKKGVDKR